MKFLALNAEFSFFTRDRFARLNHRLGVRPSVCLSVCLCVRHTLQFQNDACYDRGIFNVGCNNDSSFL